MRFWFCELRKWVDSKNSEDHKVGMRTMSALYRTVSLGQ